MWFIPGIKRTWLGILAWLLWGSLLVKFFKFFKNFIYYFWFYWVFVTALGLSLGFACNSAGKESTCNGPVFNPWVGKIPWRRERLLTPVFWPREFHGLYSPWGHKEPKMTEQFPLSLWAFSGCIQQGLFSGFSALASHCTGCIGFSVAPHRLSCLMACGISQDQG